MKWEGFQMFELLIGYGSPIVLVFALLFLFFYLFPFI